MYKLFAILFLFIGTSANALEIKEKPIQCGNLAEITPGIVDYNEEFLLKGTGLSLNKKLESFETTIFLFYNPTTPSWTLLEIDGYGSGCVINIGTEIKFSLDDEITL